MKIFFPFPTPILRGEFVSRPQRFLVEVKMEDGRRVVAYCANPGSFGCSFEKGSRILLWKSPDRKRKREFTWRAIRIKAAWVGTDTHLANQLVGKALMEKLLPPFHGFDLEKTEPRASRRRRLDFLLRRRNERYFVEVKSVAVSNHSVARFPDSKSSRARAHIMELIAQTRAGNRAAIIFLVQRGDVNFVQIRSEFDPNFAEACVEAKHTGVQLLGVKHHVSARGFGPPVMIPVTIAGE